MSANVSGPRTISIPVLQELIIAVVRDIGSSNRLVGGCAPNAIAVRVVRIGGMLRAVRADPVPKDRNGYDQFEELLAGITQADVRALARMGDAWAAKTPKRWGLDARAERDRNNWS